MGLLSGLIGVVLYHAVLRLLDSGCYSWGGLKRHVRLIIDEWKLRLDAYIGHKRQVGFTLMELSIVLVIIGLIAGGILVARDLISAAAVRAQISQIEKYNTAVHTFQLKYNCLPGDCVNAATFGFPARGSYRGQGDGNGLIEGNMSATPGAYLGTCQGIGETALFWIDLSKAGLIDGQFNSATSSSPPAGVAWGVAISATNVDLLFPPAKLGQGNLIYAYSGGNWNGSVWTTTNINYFGISAVTGLTASGYFPTPSTAALSVQQAYSMDIKIDDGLPQSGNVTARGLLGSINPVWVGQSSTSATPGSATTCYDNGNIGGATQQYSMEQSNGAGVNCALSFQFQ